MDIGEILSDAAKGAAAGAVAGPIGAAIGGVGGLILSIAPGIGTYLFGPDPEKAQQTAQDVAAAVQQVTGTSDAQGVIEALAGNPALKGQLQVALATIAAQRAAADRASDVAMLQASVADLASARAMQTSLIQAGTPQAWTTTVLAGIVVASFFGFTLLLGFGVIRPDASNQIAIQFLYMFAGAIIAAFTTVIAFYFGSSAGSSDKTGQIKSVVDQQHETIRSLLPPNSQPMPLQ